MSELSPAARSVFDAYISHWTADPYEISPEALAAALRAAVAQTQRHPGHDIWQCDADDLLAIAAELEAQ